jgi:hypothetical protein
MSFHRRSKPGIVHFDAEDTVRDHQLSPRTVYKSGIRQDAEVSFEKRV